MKHLTWIELLKGKVDMTDAFIDVNLHDIPETVRLAVMVLIKRGAKKVSIVDQGGVKNSLKDLTTDIDILYVNIRGYNNVS